MYRIIIVLIGVLSSLPLLADSKYIDTFYWLEGQTNLPIIDLNGITKTAQSNSWRYAIDCDEQQLDFKNIEKKNNSSQGQSSSAAASTQSATEVSSQSSSTAATSQASPAGQSSHVQPLFKCSSDGDLLTIKLLPGKAGLGKIKITAIAVQADQNINENFYYDVRVVEEPTSRIEECADWSCSLYTAFYMGYEGTSVSQVNQKGNLRLQYSGYSQIDQWNLHIYGDLLQTSVQEQSATQENCTEGNTTGDCDIDATIAANLGFFSPLFMDNPDSDIKIGLMAEYNLQKLDTDDVFAKSYYGGVRFAYNKIRFFSIGYGKSEGIPGQRVEFTGQLPIYGEKLIAGMVLNVSVDNKAEELGVPAGDSINVYVMTRVDFTKIFTSFTGN